MAAGRLCIRTGDDVNSVGSIIGIAFGLGVRFKLNVFFLPFVLLATAVFELVRFRRDTGAWRAPGNERGPRFSGCGSVHRLSSWGANFLGALAVVIFRHRGTPQEYIGFHARHGIILSITLAFCMLNRHFQ